MIKVSIIIPLYNKADCIARTLSSVLTQSFSDFEVIVVDDGSTDNGAEIVTKHSDPRIRLVTQKNAGPGAARNAGFSASTGRYVVFLDADDEFGPDFLEASIDNLQKAPDCAASVCAHFRGPDKTPVWTPAAAGLSISKGPWRLPTDISPEKVKPLVDSFSAGSVLCKREVVEKAGGYYEHHTTYGEDSYLWLQVLFNDLIFFDPTPHSWYHTETSKLGISRIGAYPTWPKILDPSLIRQNCPQEYRELLEKTLDYYALLAIRRCIKGRDWTTPLHILRDFPTTTVFNDEFQMLKRKVKYSARAVFSRIFKSKNVDRSHWNIKIAVTPVYSPGNPYQDQLRRHLEKKNVTVYDFRTSNLLLKRMITRYKVDVLHLHWISPFFTSNTKATSWFRAFIFLLKMCAVRLAGIKIVWTLHNLRDHEEPFPLLSQIVRKCVAKYSSAVIVHSRNAFNAVCNDYGKSIRNKLHIIPHGHYIDCYPNHISKIEARKKLGIPDSQFVYLFLGAVREYKGVDKLIEAFKQLNNPATSLIIAGKARGEKLKREIHDLCGNDDNIVFLSTFIEPEDIQIYMNACDAVVFPYQKILTSGAVILAMSFGRACIAPKVGCIPDVLDENGAFLYEKANDVHQLCEAMQQAFEKNVN